MTVRPHFTPAPPLESLPEIPSIPPVVPDLRQSASVPARTVPARTVQVSSWESLAHHPDLSAPLGEDWSWDASTGFRREDSGEALAVLRTPSIHAPEPSLLPDTCDASPFGWEGGRIHQPLPYLGSCDTVPHGEFLPFVQFGFKPANRRVIGDGRVVLPLWQDVEELLLMDVRGRGDDRQARDFNLGLAYRTFLGPEWIIGGHVYYDLLRSSQRNTFHQATVGAELLSIDWDFRINGHFPGSRDKPAHVPHGFSNGHVITSGFRERAYAGVDAEIGHRLLHWGWNDCYEVRCFLGGYYFNHRAAGFESFAGPKARLEYRVYDLPMFGEQSRLVLGAEASLDRMRHEQVAAFLQVRIPLCGWHDRDRLDPLRRRMLDLPARDVD